MSLLTIINEESDRLNRLVGEAGEMARLDAGEVELDFSRARFRMLWRRPSITARPRWEIALWTFESLRDCRACLWTSREFAKFSSI